MSSNKFIRGLSFALRRKPCYECLNIYNLEPCTVRGVVDLIKIDIKTETAGLD